MSRNAFYRIDMETREQEDYLERRRLERLAAEKPAELPCHACETKYAGAVCPSCKEERPAYTALKAMSAKPGVQPVSALPSCRYFPKALCDCGLRGTCLEAA